MNPHSKHTCAISRRDAATMKGYRSQSKGEALLAQVVTAAAAQSSSLLSLWEKVARSAG